MNTLEELLPEEVIIHRLEKSPSGKIGMASHTKSRADLTLDDLEDLVEMHEMDAAYNRSIAKDLRAIIGKRKIN